MTEIYIVAGTRTAVGTFGGALKDVTPSVLAAHVAAEAVRRAGIEPEQVGLAVFGQVVQTEPRDMYIS
jgi:acetyl-CoA C-acetyltransferase